MVGNIQVQQVLLLLGSAMARGIHYVTRDPTGLQPLWLAPAADVFVCLRTYPGDGRQREI